MSKETKGQLKNCVDELKKSLAQSEKRVSELLSQQEVLEDSKHQLKEELAARRLELESVTQALTAASEELNSLQCNDTPCSLSAASEGASDDTSLENEELRTELLNVQDIMDQKDFEIEQLRAANELETLRSMKQVQRELCQGHAIELQARDNIIQLLKDRLALLEGKSVQTPQANKTTIETPVPEGTSDITGTESVKMGEPEKTLEAAAVRKMTLPSLPRFSGEKAENGSFERWIKRINCHAEPEKWTEWEKLLQLELHVCGKAKQLYKVLPSEEKKSF